MSAVVEKPSQPSKLTAKDWLKMAEFELSKSGISAVRVEPLAKKLKVTKGSFYWHFSSRKELFEKLLTDWRIRSTNAIIERLSNANLTPKEQLKELFLLPPNNLNRTDGSALELAIRNWSQSDATVKKNIKEVDTHRLAFISGNFEALGYDKHQAVLKASCFYYTMQGFKVVGIDQNEEHLEQIFEMLL
ncbi:MAG: TetR family transcriptional regulator [Gammaproteobacteria bacterium]|nr:MAG: TetR family transcriptional regulator [Gammaproteobacteria bacterium]